MSKTRAHQRKGQEMSIAFYSKKKNIFIATKMSTKQFYLSNRMCTRNLTNKEGVGVWLGIMTH